MALHRRVALTALLALSFLSTRSAFAAPSPSLDIIPTPVWKTALRKTGKMGRGLYQYGTPIVAGERIYVGSASGGVFAINTVDGKVLWTFATEGPVFAAVKLSDDTLYAVDAEGVTYALQRETGEERWRVEIGVEVMSTPLLHDKLLYLSSMRGELIAIDPTTGAVLWRTPHRLGTAQFAVRGSSDPVYIAPHIVVGYADGRVVAHQPANGDVAWERRIAPRSAILHDVDTAALALPGRILVGSAGGGLAALEPKQGRFQWRTKIGTVNNLLVDGEVLYVTGGGTVYALDPKTGALHWSQDLPDESGLSSPVMANGRLVTVSTDDLLYVLDPTTGEVLGKRHIGGGTFGNIVSEGDRLYIVTNGSHLVAMKVP